MASQNTLMKYAMSGVCGLLFGIAAEKGRVHEPYIIRGQMNLSYFVMMKMFLGAVSSGMVSMSLLSMSSDSNRMKLEDARANFLGCLRDKGIVCSLLGGGLLGVGMTIAGTCPGMVLVQVGTLVHNSLYTLAGGLIGAFVYSLLHPTVSTLTRSNFHSSKLLSDSRGYSSTSLPIATIIACSIAVLEVMTPWTSEISQSWGGNLWTVTAWPPYAAGAVIGCLQIPLILTVRDTLSGSSSYFTLLSQALLTNRLRRAFPFLSTFREGMQNWWQVFFVCGAVAGGFLSAQASGNLHHSSPVSQSQALLGGALMIFGARLAGGCTSGHGLSGVSLLVVDSYVTVAAMFAGAIGASALLL